MYNEDYFKQVLGNDYNGKELYTPTYIPEYKKYKEVDNIIDNVSQPVNSNIKKDNKEVNPVVKKVKEIVNDVKEDFTRFYPDIYNIIVPVVERVIENNSELAITKDVIDTMTIEIYNIIEDEVNEKNESSDTLQVSSKPIRRPKNKNLCDLIQILLIDHLRPHHRPMPPRPPMPMPPHHPFPEDFNL